MKLILILVSLVSLSLPTKNITLTNAERRFAIRYLNETQKDLEKEIKGLSENQLQHRSLEHGWTIAECLQHLAVVESGVLGMVRSSEHCVEQQPVQRAEIKYTNEGLINAVIQRPERLSTPDMVLSGKYSKCEEALASFNADREEIKNGSKSHKQIFMPSYYLILFSVCSTPISGYYCWLPIVISIYYKSKKFKNIQNFRRDNHKPFHP